MRFQLLFLSLIIATLTSCDADPYPGYTALGPEGIVYKVLRFEDERRSPDQGDVVRFRMGRVEFDSLVWQDSKVQVMRFDTSGIGLRSALASFHTGDSVSLLIEPEAYMIEFGEYPYPRSRLSDIHMSILDVIPEHEWLAAVELDMAAKSVREEQLISDYLTQREDESDFRFEHGYWVKELVKGNKLRYRAGEELYVNYLATLLDGTVIDDRSNSEDALVYALGMQGQLIPGLVSAIKHIERGQELELILPSALAFGEKGSAGNIVLPWTPVRYILSVREREIL